MYKNSPSHFIGLVLLCGDRFLNISLAPQGAGMEMVLLVNSYMASHISRGLENTLEVTTAL